MTTLTIGDHVPNFSFQATSGLQAQLSDYQGKTVILYFYPKDNTPGCTTESKDFTAQYQRLANANAVIFGVSRDSLKSHENFKAKFEMPFELISDADSALCNLFDVIKEKNMYGRKYMGIERSTFMINPEGVLSNEWRKVKVPGHVDAILASL